MAKSPIHEWTPRIEDDALLRGLGRFIDDAPVAGQAHAVFVRSVHAHAEIVSLKITDALRARGVVAVLTAADMDAAGVTNTAFAPPLMGRGGKPLIVPDRPPLAKERVLHVGHPVAMVIADTLHAAQDAAELVHIEYKPLPAVTDVAAALETNAPQLWPQAAGNLAIDWPGMTQDDANAAEVERIFSAAPVVANVRVRNQRLAVMSMEPRGATASYDTALGNYSLRVCSQGAGMLRDQIAPALKLKPGQLRVTTEDVGGAFGLKTSGYPEYPALLVAARITGRSVHWMSSRTEAFQSDNAARDSVTQAELALDVNGKFLALRVRHVQNLGAFAASVGAHLATNNFIRCLPAMYSIPKIDTSVQCVFTNTLPTGPYRGAGRPEANYVLERLIDEAARISGIDAVELRRRNLIAASEIPYKTAIGLTYDTGDFPAVFEKALVLADQRGFAKRRERSAAGGKLRGFGISCFLEHAGALPKEGARLAFPGGQRIEVFSASQSTGQGHASVYPRILAARLGISPSQVVFRQGDSAEGIAGYASVGSRTTQAVGGAIAVTAHAMLAKGKKIAARLLESGEKKISYRDGAFEVSGTNRRIPLFDLAARAQELKRRGEIEESLDTYATTDVPITFPNGCHIAEVEIDPSTGVVGLVAYTAVDDCGNVIDHTLMEAQLQGGVAQGIGQALMEQVVYDAESGQLVSASLMDYAVPRSTEVPEVRGDVVSSPATTNPLGVKGVGEAGTTASLAAIMNAVADAIPNGAANKLDMPATPEKIWRACRVAQT